jgi:hypothetical protein
VNGPAFLSGWIVVLAVVGTIVLLVSSGASASNQGAPATWVKTVDTVRPIRIELNGSWADRVACAPRVALCVNRPRRGQRLMFGHEKPRRAGLSTVRPRGLELHGPFNPQGPQPESPAVDGSSGFQGPQICAVFWTSWTDWMLPPVLPRIRGRGVVALCSGCGHQAPVPCSRVVNLSRDAGRVLLRCPRLGL